MYLYQSSQAVNFAEKHGFIKMVKAELGTHCAKLDYRFVTVGEIWQHHVDMRLMLLEAVREALESKPMAKESGKSGVV